MNSAAEKAKPQLEKAGVVASKWFSQASSAAMGAAVWFQSMGMEQESEEETPEPTTDGYSRTL